MLHLPCTNRFSSKAECMSGVLALNDIYSHIDKLFSIFFVSLVLRIGQHKKVSVHFVEEHFVTVKMYTIVKMKRDGSNANQLQ